MSSEIEYYTDDEAAHILDTGPRSPTAPNLSGTMFWRSSGAQTRATDPTPNEDTMGRSLQPDTPQQGGGESQ